MKTMTLVSFLFCGVASAAGPVYSEATGHYYELSADWGSWETANAIATSRHMNINGWGSRGFLACIETDEEQVAIVSMFGEQIGTAEGVYGAWIGARKAWGTDRWEWVTGPYQASPAAFYDGGEKLLYSRWSHGEPNNFQGTYEDAAVWGWGAGGSWNDLFNWADAPALIEYAPVRCGGDLNGDNQVDDADFVLFVEAATSDCGAYGECTSDFDLDGFVGDSDFVLFVGAYDALLCN